MCFGSFPLVTLFGSLLASIACFDYISRFGSLALIVVLFHFHWLVISGFDGCIFLITSSV